MLERQRNWTEGAQSEESRKEKSLSSKLVSINVSMHISIQIYVYMDAVLVIF